MKHLLRYTLFLLATLLPVMVMADDKKIDVKKYVTENADGTYTLDLETYATGWTKQTQAYVATDFVLVLDRSGSMIEPISAIKVAEGKTLDSSKIYVIKINGAQYYLKWGKYDGKNRWWRIPYGSTTIDDEGESFSKTKDYEVKSEDLIYETGSATRLDALKSAVKDFLTLVLENNPETGPKHRVATVWYGGTSTTGYASDYLGNVKSGTSSDADATAYFALKELKESGSSTTTQETLAKYLSQIDKVYYNTASDCWPDVKGATLCDYGMQVAYNTLYQTTGDADKRNKVVIFFTDGEPGNYSGRFYVPVAQSAGKYAAKIKNTTAFQHTVEGESGESKTFNPVIYSIGIMDSHTASVAHNSKSDGSNGSGAIKAYDKFRFMHFISSNYTMAESDFNTDVFASGTNGTEDPHDYFVMSDGSDLADVFAKIATKELKDRDERLDAESTVVLDVMSKDFELPDGVDVDDIKLYTCDAVTTHTGTTVKWDATSGTGKVEVHKDASGKKVASGGTTEYWVPLTTVTPVITDNKKVEVNGYDFVKNFVGVKRDFTDNDTKNIIGWTGQKLVIEFVIERSPSNQGGTNMATNASTSGVYIDGGSTLYSAYPVPDVPVPAIIITKKGLALGESAVFEVERVTDGTGETADGDNVFKNTYILTKTGTDDPTIKFVSSGPGYYKVTEKTWAWNTVTTYDANSDGTPETDGTSYVLQLVKTDVDKTFTFGVKSTMDKVLPKHHDEANKNNKFE